MFLVPFTRAASPLSRSFDRLFDDTFDQIFGNVPALDPAVARAPALDLSESDGQYTVTLDLPGVAKDEVKVCVDGRLVSIEAQASKTDERKDGDRVVYRERSVSSYARTFRLPGEVDQSASQAKLDNGVLTLVLAKQQARSAARLAIN
jgi:HSP20 family protein